LENPNGFGIYPGKNILKVLIRQPMATCKTAFSLLKVDEWLWERLSAALSIYTGIADRGWKRKKSEITRPA